MPQTGTIHTSLSRIINQPNSVKKFAAKGLARTAIYISKNTPARFIKQRPSCSANQNRTAGRAGSMCIHGHKKIELWKPHVLDFASKRGIGIIISMDRHYHRTLFGPKQNHRGYLFDELIANNNLIIENVGHPPTFESRGTKTCIDVTLTRGLTQTIKD